MKKKKPIKFIFEFAFLDLRGSAIAKKVGGVEAQQLQS